MACLYQLEQGDVRYEVRSAGASLRLYTNGAFHSQYNPNYLFTGAVWDLLALPSLFREKPITSALVLGVGGGAVIHQLEHLHSPGITGIEIDPVHVQIATDFFGVDTKNTQLVTGDARDWLKGHRQTFDYIVDDIFLHGDADPERPFAPDGDWLDLLTAHLRPRGVLVQNHIDIQSARRWMKMHRSEITERFTRGFLFRTDKYENAVIALYNENISEGQMRSLARSALDRLPRKDTRRLRASWRALKL